MLSRFSFRTRLAIVLCVFNVLIAVAASLLIGRQVVHILQVDSSADMEVVAKLAAVRLGDRLTDISARLSMLAALDAAPDGAGPAANAAAAIPPRCRCGLAWAALVGPDGQLRQTSDETAAGAGAMLAPWFHVGQMGPAILPDSADFVVFATPLGAPGLSAWVLLAGLDRSSLNQTLQGFGAELMPTQQVQLLLLREGQVIAGPPGIGTSPVARATPGLIEAAPSGLWRDPTRGATDSDPAIGAQEWPDGGRYVAGAALLSPAGLGRSQGWTVVARKPAEVAAQPAIHIQRDIIVGALALALLFGAAGVIVADRMAAPLRRVARAVAGASQGGGTELERIERSLKTLRLRVEDAEDEARRDPLTGLLNRAGLQTALTRRATPQPGLVCFLDLDGFKEVNDQLGHAAGDLLLRIAADRLVRCLRREELVSRLGGDEFVFTVLNRGGSSELARTVPSRVLDVLSRPYEMDGISTVVSVSIGTAFWDGTEPSFTSALEQADSALRVAKQSGKAQVVWYSEGPLAPITPLDRRMSLTD